MTNLPFFPPSIPTPYKEEDSIRFTLTLTFLEEGLLVVTRNEQEVVYTTSISYPLTCDINLSSVLGELVYSYPFLTFNYKKILLRFFPTERVVVPTALTDPQKDPFWLATVAFPLEGSYVGTFEVDASKDECVIATWDKESFSFLRRTYSGVLPLPLTVLSLSTLQKESLIKNHRVVHILVDKSRLELSMWQKGELRFTNSFERHSYTNLSSEASLQQQVLFYWTAMCKSLQIDNVVEDEVKLFLPPKNFIVQEALSVLQENFIAIFAEMGVVFSIHSYTDL